MKEREKLKKMGRYKIESVIGRGAMGVVYKAYDPIIERYVAIKAVEISKSLPADEYDDYMSRFYREAQAAGRLSHPNIVTIYDVSTDKNTGIPFIVMEFIDGHDLNYFLNKGMMFSLNDVLNIIEQVADALDYAHQNGIVHRDIKCSNILLQKEMKVKVVDFGIAKTITSNLTREGQFLGTPNYMSPEQIQGLTIDHRTDIYSLGIVLYRLLTGERPFQADSFAGISYKILNEQPAPPKLLNPILPIFCDHIISKMLAKDPNKRYQSAKNLREDIWNLQNQDHSSIKAIGAKIEYKIYFKNLLNQIKKYKLSLFASLILLLVVIIINISINNRSIQNNESEINKSLINSNKIINNNNNNKDIEYNKYKQFGLNFYNNKNYSKAIINMAKALSIKKDDELTNNLIKSINETLGKDIRCALKGKDSIQINIKGNGFEPGYIIIEQKDNLCQLIKIKKENVNNQFFIENVVSSIFLYYININENNVLYSTLLIEKKDNLLYNLYLSLDKDNNKLNISIN